MVFSAVSIDSSFKVVDLVRVDERNKTRTKNNLKKQNSNICMLRCATLTQLDLE